VAHACHPSYSGGREEEDLGLKPARANSFPDPIPITKRAGEVAQVKSLSSNPSTKNKERKKQSKLLA
jgi:hypothetical protein